ncbi:MAG: MBG domain-containing protein, partial [Kiritimatiellae bacterium]|nr:MBG domain-containing protein [Kiritimatiellia bacterium]
EPVEGTVSVEVEEAGAQIFFSNLTPTYNGEAQAPAVTTDPEGFSYALTFDGSPEVPVDASTYAVVAVITEEGAPGSASDTFTIDPVPLTVQADDVAKFEGDPDPALSWSVISGELFESDTLSGSLARDSGENIGPYTIRQGTLSASGNYILTFQTGTLTILEAGDAPWVLQADFDDLNTGVLRGQGGWSGNNDSAAQVVQDPEDENNQVFRFAPSSNNHIQRDLSTPMQAGEVGTLFFRFYVPAGSSRINQQIRLPNNNPIRIKWDSDPSEPVLWIFGEDMTNTDLQQVEQPIARDTWYNFWMVIDNINGTYRIYIQGGDYPDQTFVTVADMGGDPNTHPFETGLIDALYFIGWNNGPMLYDDFYLALGGENLSNPAAVIPPPSDYEQWLMDEGLDPETDPAAEEPGTGFTYRELHVMGARLLSGEWQDLLYVTTPAQLPGGGLTLHMQGRAGRSYRLFYRDDLQGGTEGDAEWLPLGEPVELENDGPVGFEDDAPGAQRFYRIQVTL